MIYIQYPAHDFKIRNEKGVDLIFDMCRKSWVKLTPEEWVRQNFIVYLTQAKNYPPSVIAVEREIKLPGLRKRFDVLVYKNSRPWLIIECKESNVAIDEAVIRQILNYNIVLDAEFLIVTNGISTFGVKLDKGRFTWIDQLPSYQ